MTKRRGRSRNQRVLTETPEAVRRKASWDPNRGRREATSAFTTAHAAGSVEDAIWALRTVEACGRPTSVGQAQNRPVRKCVDRRPSRVGSTRRRAASTSRRTRSASRDGGGGSEPGPPGSTKPHGLSRPGRRANSLRVEVAR